MQSGGTIHAQPLSSGHEASVIKGELVLGPSSVLKIVCAPNGFDCVSVNASGPAYLDGKVEMSFAPTTTTTTTNSTSARGSPGDEYQIVRSNRMLGRFHTLSVDSGDASGGSVEFAPAYTESGAAIRVVPSGLGFKSSARARQSTTETAVPELETTTDRAISSPPRASSESKRPFDVHRSRFFLMVLVCRCDADCHSSVDLRFNQTKLPLSFYSHRTGRGAAHPALTAHRHTSSNPNGAPGRVIAL